MPVKTALWRITQNGLSEARPSALKSEADLHKWVEANPKLVGGDLMLIGSEVVTDFGGRIDLLALDPEGVVHVIELKRDKTPREVVAQALDYASWVASRNSDDLHDIYRRYKGDDLGPAFKERFGSALPQSVGEEHRITIVASSLDESSERIVSYLSEHYGVAINAVFFSVFADATGDVLTRTWLLDPEQVENRAEEQSAARKERGEWTGFWFVNVGVTKEEDRSWDDARSCGFVSGGQGTRWRDFMRKLEIGDRIFAYVSGRGYVGYGEVTQEAVMARDFHLANGTALMQQDLKGTGHLRNINDEERADYVVGVNWKRTLDLNDARKYPGIFANQAVVCKIKDAATVEYLRQQFGLPVQAAA